MPFIFDIGFLPIRVWDILDILIFGYLIYRIYKLLRGSIAFNIFIGVAMLFVAWWLVGALKMDLLSMLLGQFVSVGVIATLSFKPHSSAQFESSIRVHAHFFAPSIGLPVKFTMERRR